MIFEAHNAGIGDCFSIMENDKIYVIDGGSSNRIINDFKGKTINVCIVTHNDRDHTQGVQKMLSEKSGVTINEIWLPGIWQPIIEHVQSNPKSLSELTNYSVCKGFVIDDLSLLNGLLDNTSESIDSFYETSDEKLQFIEMFEMHNELIKTNPEKYFNSPNIDLNRILGIFSLALERGCFIKFFYPEETMQSLMVPNYPFRMLNSSLLCSLKKVKADKLINLLYLSKNNKYSLVFEYMYKENPIILLNADSDLYFIDNTNPLDYGGAEILVTSPHHGSESNSSVYTKIIGSKITWVKSGGSMKCLTGDTYKFISHHQKFCNNLFVTTNKKSCNYKNNCKKKNIRKCGCKICCKIKGHSRYWLN